jgi:hypothetical protein
MLSQYFTPVSVVAFLLLTGCGNDRPSIYPVSGVVLYQGQVVEGASVVFSSSGPPAQGVTNAEGKFLLRTFADGDGATEGSHRITITKFQSLPSTEQNPYPAVRNLLPEKYARPDSSGLAKEVTSSGENNFTFDLKD